MLAAHILHPAPIQTSIYQTSSDVDSDESLGNTEHLKLEKSVL